MHGTVFQLRFPFPDPSVEMRPQNGSCMVLMGLFQWHQLNIMCFIEKPSDDDGNQEQKMKIDLLFKRKQGDDVPRTQQDTKGKQDDGK